MLDEDRHTTLRHARPSPGSPRASRGHTSCSGASDAVRPSQTSPLRVFGQVREGRHDAERPDASLRVLGHPRGPARQHLVVSEHERLRVHQRRASGGGRLRRHHERHQTGTCVWRVACGVWRVPRLAWPCQIRRLLFPVSRDGDYEKHGFISTPAVRRFLFLVSRHVNSMLDSKHGCKAGFTTPYHVHWG